jgi:(2R)-ethylmalonyl-CoA mutase
MERDRPWVMRTYAGHSSAADSNALYRHNLGKGQTGLSVAFDLPTDRLRRLPLPARPRVGAGRTSAMRRLFDGIPLAGMNVGDHQRRRWLLALSRGGGEVRADRLRGTPERRQGTSRAGPTT